MTLEHIAINHPEPQAAAQWYAEHLGLRVLTIGGPTAIHFLADERGSMLELYSNAQGAMPDYANLSPYTLHLAFAAKDIGAERERLVAAGARADGEIETNAAGDRLAFLRDPWGVTVQLVSRSAPLG
jgi:glyoxylase I family protein